MKSILIGNGINIEFSQGEYFNSSIIKRAIKNVLDNSFDKSAYSSEVLVWLNESFDEGVKILNDGYEKSMDIAWTDNQKKSLKNFYYTYKDKKLTKETIGFEYYFLLNALFCNRYKLPRTINWETDVRGHREEGLRRLFIDAIYNQGEINKLYLKFPEKLKEYLLGFDNILTTNYDSNLETFIEKTVNYLHGAFHILDLKYDNTDIVNIALGTYTNINPKSKHLYSISITDFCGEEKMEPLLRAERINKVFSYAKKMLEESKRTKTKMPPKLEAILTVASKNPNYTVADRYNFIQISEISDELVILGLSPHNDNHIFEKINGNNKITKIEYKFNSKVQGKFAEQYFCNKTIDVTSVKEFWKNVKSL